VKGRAKTLACEDGVGEIGGIGGRFGLTVRRVRSYNVITEVEIL
jgi:hypothetical protein